MKNKNLKIFVLFFLCLIFLGYSYVIKYQDKLMGFCAEYYFKKNNIAKAQEYYEKAFELGLNDSKQREIYINSIINSPLTLNAQEKLIKFLENPKDDVARLKAEYFISDLKKEIHRKYPENFIASTVFNQKIMRWSEPSITYGFKENPEIPNYYKDEIRKAFIEWEKATKHQIYFSEVNTNPNIIIKFETENPANTEKKKYIVAYTTPIINLNTLDKMEIIFYLKDPFGKEFTENQIYNTALHEIAHALGFMGHSNNCENIMYFTKDTLIEHHDLREQLTEADINTIKLLYKIKPQITDKPDIIAEYAPFMVLGSEEEVNNKKIEEARLYIKKAPNLPAGYIDLAEEYVVAKDYKKAIKSLERALKYADTEEIRSMIYFNLAVTNFYIDSFDKALDYLEKSMKINDTEEKHYLLAEIYVREGETQKAIDEYSQLISKNPNNVEYTISLTNIYVLNRDFIKARKVLKSFFEKNPNEKTNPRFESYGILKFGL